MIESVSGINTRVTNAGNAIDGQIQGATASLSVAAIPEPTSLALGAMAAAGFMGLRRRRKAVA